MSSASLTEAEYDSADVTSSGRSFQVHVRGPTTGEGQFMSVRLSD